MANEGSAFRMRDLGALPFSKVSVLVSEKTFKRFAFLKSEGFAFRMRRLSVLPSPKVRVLLFG